MKPESMASDTKPVEVRPGLWKVKSGNGKGFFRVGVSKKQGQANSLYLEISGRKQFEIGNDCDTCHFWFKCLQEPKLFSQKKIVNLPKSLSVPRPLDADLLHDISPVIDLMEKGEHYVFNTAINLIGPYKSDDENSYFHNGEFHEIWDIEDPAAEDILSGWEHYEGKTPRIYRHEPIVEKQFDFLIPLVPLQRLKPENIRLYQQMIAQGDRPRILVLGLLQRAIPESVSTGQNKNLHSFFAGFVLDGHHKLTAYQRAGVPANCLVILSTKASKYFLLEGEGASPRNCFEERLASLAQ
ncbi:MAG: hypothetical protein A2X36_01660 [Elusimicrobia bacterium GWA2_69_24]|nr:MAG: hypothetical protein A2X36_01660 [Elusimicrobia bacterium GWA2_69_24]HBL19133.1 hypothetical protein [Elusimicrobiota bacterium]